MDTLIAFLVAAIAGALFLRSYLQGLKRREAAAARLSGKRQAVFARTYLAASPY